MLELSVDGLFDIASSDARHGLGLFETVRVADGNPVRLELHVERLAAGAAFLGTGSPPGAGRIASFLEGNTGIKGVAKGVLRLYAIDGRLVVSVSEAFPATPSIVSIAVSKRVRRFSGNPLSRFKTLSCLENELLRREAESLGVFELIAPNEAGRLTDGGRTSLFVLSGGRVVTPPLSDGVLPGIARRVLLEAGIAEECCLYPEDIDACDAAFLANALRGAIPVSIAGGRVRSVFREALEAATLLLA